MPIYSPEETLAARRALGIDEDRFPRSIAIIMDGNGRWAERQGLPRVMGHRAGAKVVSKIVAEAARLGLTNLALYSFSIENWSRPAEEINALMQIYAERLAGERPTIMANNIRLRHLGRRDELPQSVLDELDESTKVSASNTGMFLSLAINYSSRGEIVDATRKLAAQVAAGRLSPGDIDEAMLGENLDTHGVPDPDLVIRTSGEMRLSNFLLWQVSYSEFYATQTHWPDFNEQELHKALQAFAERHRRFGGLDNK